jgi:hypothetical protein
MAGEATQKITSFAPKWKRVRDVVAGRCDKAYYKARLKRSDFFNGTWRTIAGLGGMAFRKPPTVEVPKGSSLSRGRQPERRVDGQLAMDALDEVLSVGRLGVLVDHPPQPDECDVVPLTGRAAREAGLAPTLHLSGREHHQLEVRPRRTTPGC